MITFETAITWCERQSECCSAQLLLLKRMGDLAATERVTNLKQKKRVITILLIMYNKSPYVHMLFYCKIVFVRLFSYFEFHSDI